MTEQSRTTVVQILPPLAPRARKSPSGRMVSPTGKRRMAEPPLTRVTLLARIKDGRDTDAWREFVQLYGPVVYRFARNRGLQDADAADLMQDVLRSVARNAHRME